MGHRMDLNRFKKIYPLMRRSPRFIDTSAEVEAFTVQFTDSDVTLEKDYTLQRAYPSAPAVVISVENDNMNTYVKTIAEVNGEYVVTIVISHLPAANTPVTIHGHAAEIDV